MRGGPLWPPAVPRLAARPSQSNPRGSGPEVLKREHGHVTAETGVAEVAVFGALQPNVAWNFKGTLWNSTQNILPIHCKIWLLYNIDILRAHKCFWNCPQCFNPLWPSDTIWHQRSWSTLVELMTYCLTAPSHYLHQCWLTISKILHHSF